MPFVFERNAGQASRGVRFVARRPGVDVFFWPDRVEFALKQSVVALKFVNSRKQAALSGENKTNGASNYLIGGDPSGWITEVDHYQRVRYGQIYAGVDAVFYSTGSQLEYDLIVQPGADVSGIAFELEGARRIRSRDGDVVVDFGMGELRCKRPLVYQEIDRKRRLIEAGYVLSGSHVRFKVAPYDRSKPLIIDPVLDYGTYLGGSGNEWGYAITTDAIGDAYVTGMTQSSNFPVKGGTQLMPGVSLGEVFVTKLRPDSTGIVYSTYIGGDGAEGNSVGYVGGIAVNDSGSAYVTGVTYSPNFPTTANSFQPAFGTHDVCGAGPAAGYCGDAFVLKLNPAGDSLVYSSFLGGSNHDEGKALAIDADGDAYVLGITTSSDFPTTSGAFQRILQFEDAFISKISSDGSQLLYSTLLGGSGYDLGLALAVDASGRAHVTGMTESDDFPTRYALQTKLGSPWDVFVAKLNPEGSDVEFSTLLGGVGTQEAMGIALGSSGNIYLAGYTDSADYPVVNAFQPDFAGGGGNGFVTKLDPDGSTILYSTFLGGNDAVSELDAIAVDSSGAAYVAGSGGSDFPIVNSVRSYAGGADIVLTKLTPDGTGVYFSSFFGGTGYDLASAITLDRQDRLLLTGLTTSPNMPTASGFQRSVAGGSDAFVLRFRQPTTDGPILSAPRIVQIGNVYVGVISPDKSIRVTNTGTRSLNISKIVASANESAATDCKEVAPGGACSITVSLKLDSAGAGTGTFTVYDDAADSPQTFTLRGIGVYGGDVELVSLTAGPLSGTYGSLVQPFSAVIRNKGPYDAEGVTLRISNNVGGSDCNPCTLGTLKAGASTTLNFSRRPVVFGNITVTGTVTTATRSPDTNPGNNVRSVVVPVPLYSPDVTAIDFGPQAMSAHSASRRITFRSIGGGPFRLSLSATGDFSLKTNCGTSDDAGCFADVAFTPTAEGVRTGALWIDEFNAGTSQRICLIGSGAVAPASALSISTAMIDFGVLLINGSRAVTISLTSTGTADLNITGLELRGSGFDFNTSCPIRLAVGKACTISVRFVPPMPGSFTGGITIRSDVPGDSQVVSLKGQAMQISVPVSRPDRSPRNAVQPTPQAVPEPLPRPAPPLSSTTSVAPESSTPDRQSRPAPETRQLLQAFPVMERGAIDEDGGNCSAETPRGRQTTYKSKKVRCADR